MKKIGIIITVCVVSLMAGIGIGKEVEGHRQSSETELQEEYVPWDRKTPKPVKSKLKDLDHCYLCGNDNRSLMGLFRKYDDLGIICVNKWYVLDMKIRNHDDAGNLTGPQGHINTTYTGTGEGGCFFHARPNSDRGISKVTVSYGENSTLDMKFIRKHLCQDCLDKLMEVMETYGPEDESWEPRDLCLVDFNTLELYSLQGNYSSYYVGDYYVEIDNSKEEELKVTAVYAPVLEENGKKRILE